MVENKQGRGVKKADVGNELWKDGGFSFVWMEDVSSCRRVLRFFFGLDRFHRHEKKMELV